MHMVSKPRAPVIRRNCGVCQFWSDLHAQITEDYGIPHVEALCLSEQSIKSGKFVRGNNSCDKFIAGKPIDEPPAEPQPRAKQEPVALTKQRRGRKPKS